MILSDFKGELVYLLITILYSVSIVTYILIQEIPSKSNFDTDFETIIIQDYNLTPEKDICPPVLEIKQNEVAYCV